MIYKQYFKFKGLEVFNEGYVYADKDSFNLTSFESQIILPARLLHLEYADYLFFCKSFLGAEIVVVDSLPIPLFKFDSMVLQLIKLLNKRMQLVLTMKKEKENKND